MKGEIWAERRRAILLAADALEARNAEKWSQVDDMLFTLRSARTGTQETLRKADARERIEKMLTEEPTESFATPFTRVNDCLLGGFRRGQTVVIAADPAHGKSLMVDQVLEHMSFAGANCHLMINEMTASDRTARWVQRKTGVLEEKVIAQNLTDQERGDILRAANRFPFDITQIAGDSFRDVADRLVDEKPDVAAVDLLSRFDYRDERELRLGVTTLADAAHRANCVLILCHHLNEKRVAESGMRPTPTLTDIRDSGSVKNFADVVMFLNRDADPQEPTKLLETGSFYAVKVRAGQPGGVRIRLNPERLRFEELDGQPPKDEALFE